MKTEDIIERNKPESWRPALRLFRERLVIEILRLRYPDEVTEAERLADSVAGKNGEKVYD